MKNLIDKISASYCNALNKDNCNIMKIDYNNYFCPNDKLHIIKENMMEGDYFSSKKTCEFLCDKSKYYEIKMALNMLIDLKMGLFEINPCIKDMLFVDIMRFYEIYDI